MKKLFAMILAATMILSLCPAAFAAGLATITLNLTCENAELDQGINEVVVQPGDSITVYYEISASAQSSVSVSQNEIYYDHDFFELETNSNRVESKYRGYHTSAQAYSNGMHYVFFNTADSYSHSTTPAKIGSFVLKVIATQGQSTVASTNVGLRAVNGQKYPLTTYDLHVSIGSRLPVGYNIVLNPANGDNSTMQVVAKEGSIKLPNVTRLYYTFDGWADTFGNVYQAGEYYTPNSNMTLRAQWKAVAKRSAPVGIVGVRPSEAGKTDGKLTGTSASMEYSKTSDFAAAIACTGSEVTNLAAGTYYVRFKADPANNIPSSQYAVISIAQGNSAPGAPAGLVGVKPSRAGANDGKITGTRSDMEYSTSTDFKAAVSCGEGETVGLKAGTYYVRIKANIETSTPAGNYASVVIQDGPASAGAPANLSAEKTSMAGRADGKIIGTTAKMEYSLTPDFKNARNCGEGSTSGLAAGTYYVRIRASENNAAGPYVIVVVPAGEGTAIAFNDVAVGTYYYDAVNWAVANNITLGTTPTAFSPNMPCTRAQVVTFLWRAAGSPIVTGDSFKDIPSGSYYEQAVAWAVANGITNGNGKGTFGPNDTCTRAQIVTFLWRYAGSPAVSGKSFSDVSSNSYYEKAVIWAAAKSVTSGNGAGGFDPAGICTRAHTVTFLYRFCTQ